MSNFTLMQPDIGEYVVPTPNEATAPSMEISFLPPPPPPPPPADWEEEYYECESDGQIDIGQHFQSNKVELQADTVDINIVSGRYLPAKACDLIKMSEENGGLVLSASTGLGKTYMVMNSAGKRVIAVPNITIAQQLAAKYEDSFLVYGEVEIGSLIECDSYIVVWNSLPKLANALGDSVGEYNLWIDEIHITLARFRGLAVRRMMNCAHRFRTVTGMTGTDVGELLTHFHGFKRVAYVKQRPPIKVYVTDEPLSAINKAFEGIKVFHMNNKAIASAVAPTLNAQLFNADTKGTKAHSSIVDDGEMDSQILIATNSFNVGLSISSTEGTEITVVITIESLRGLGAQDVEQIANRFRDEFRHASVERLIIQHHTPDPEKAPDLRTYAERRAELSEAISDEMAACWPILESLRVQQQNVKDRGFGGELINKFADSLSFKSRFYKDEFGQIQLDEQAVTSELYESWLKTLTVQQRVEWLTTDYSFVFSGRISFDESDESRKAEKKVKKIARRNNKESRKELYANTLERAKNKDDIVQIVEDSKHGKMAAKGLSRHEIDCASQLLSISKIGAGFEWKGVIELANEMGCDSKSKYDSLRHMLISYAISKLSMIGEGTVRYEVSNVRDFRRLVADRMDSAGGVRISDELIEELISEVKLIPNFVIITGKPTKKKVIKLIKSMFKVSRGSEVVDGERRRFMVAHNERPFETDVKIKGQR